MTFVAYFKKRNKRDTHNNNFYHHNFKRKCYGKGN